MTGDGAPAIVWFRRDLRLADNPALAHAAVAGTVVPVYILDEAEDGCGPPGAAARWWLHGSLAALTQSLSAHGSGLVLRRGEPGRVLADLVAETGARRICWTRIYEPWVLARDARISSDLAGCGIETRSFDGDALFKPGTVTTRTGGPFRVFTPFWNACLGQSPPASPIPAPRMIAALSPAPQGEALEAWRLRPAAPDWAAGLRDTWTPGEDAARARLDAFVAVDLAEYPDARDRPGRSGTSGLSPHLACGDIGPRQVWHAVAAARDAGRVPGNAADAFLRELGWREFCRHLLFHFPAMAGAPLRAEFSRFPWRDDPAALAAWRAGRTGYPFVDAGMRELWHTGWMHNRARMAVASFLVKHLLLPWQVGEAWFRDTLVDADRASNAGNWQWVAGCGADAAPYFRIFNPVRQGRRFDPDGAYVRRWVPELARLAAADVHAPWEAADATLAAAGIRLGRDYPAPIVDHGMARRRALSAFAAMRDGSPDR